MTRLASSISNLKAHYTVVVIGSGYGGSVLASRMARAGQTVCVLERGKEFQPGEFPDTALKVAEELQLTTPSSRAGWRHGLYDMRLNNEMDVLAGCGLGGGSLINASVAMRPDPRVFSDPIWPQAFRDDVDSLLERGFERAEAMLKPTPYPSAMRPLPKLEALAVSAKALNAKFYKLPINVNFEEGINHVGVEQHACVACGDCVTGCNYGAKNTLAMNYLPDARNYGAEIYTLTDVRFLERQGAEWIVHFQLIESGQEDYSAPTMQVRADIVVVAAGVLGTNEILMRSKQKGLPLSDRLGARFSGNSDSGGIAYNGSQVVNAMGFGAHYSEDKPPVGPTITGIIDMRDTPELDQGIIMEDAAVPSALTSTMPLTLAVLAAAEGKNTAQSLAEKLEQVRRELDSGLYGSDSGAAHNTQIFLVMGHDDSGGKLFLANDRIHITWPDLLKLPILQKISDAGETATRPMEGVFIHNPTWNKLLHSMLTVHPLGGCGMADDASGGVVNHKGQVFAGAQGSQVYDNLYVADAAIFPRSIGTNPLLTISALAERCALILAKDRGWTIPYELPSHPSGTEPQTRIGIQFSETMQGYFSDQPGLDYAQAAEQGKNDGASFRFVVTITSDDVQDMIDNPDHKARLVGTATAPALASEPMAVTDGEFQLFVKDLIVPDTLHMLYRMTLTSVTGSTFYLSGFKTINDKPLSVWAENTTLYITIEDAQHKPIGKGILTVSPADFARMLSTVRVLNSPNEAARIETVAAFSLKFGGLLGEVYTGIFTGSAEFKADAKPRQKRPLRVKPPQVWFFPARDGVQLRLTRYQGGAKGPVLLIHDLGTSSSFFALDTIGTNLVEYLYANACDVWLLDYRASIGLPLSSSPINADDIATNDVPAAVEKVRQLSGAPGVHVVAHGFGGLVLCMALLNGMQGVESAICSQAATHIEVPTATAIKAGLHLPGFLEALGAKSLPVYVSSHPDWKDRVLDKVLELSPEELINRCDSATCHRITAIYGPVYAHAQLNAKTHQTLHEIFGAVNVHVPEHLAEIIRKQHLVNARGEDVYLPHVDRLALPVTILHGALNECFLPQGTSTTIELLRSANAGIPYQHVLLPNYGHHDCLIGQNAAQNVYPLIWKHLTENMRSDPA